MSNISVKSEFHIHPSIQDLIWYTDGPNKNLLRKTHQVFFNSKILSIELLNENEPSAISLSFPIEIPNNGDELFPPYFPSYESLTPPQRWTYLKFLENPYDENFDIGYVFLFYYGLERFLTTKKVKKAYNAIIELLKVHKNNSFIQYASTTSILLPFITKKYNLLYNLNCLDEEIWDLTPFDLIIYYCVFFKIALPTSPLLYNHKKFGVQKNEFFIKYKDYVERYLSIHPIYPHLVMKNEILPIKTVTIFANISLPYNIEIPDYFHSNALVTQIAAVLNDAYQDVRKNLDQKQIEKRPNPESTLKRASRKKTRKYAKFNIFITSRLLEEKNEPARNNPKIIER